MPTDTERLDWLQKLDGEIYCRGDQGHFELTVPDDDAEGAHDAVIAVADTIRDLIDMGMDALPDPTLTGICPPPSQRSAPE